MTQERREADGRKARGKAAKPLYQRRVSPSGAVKYAKQVTDPRTGRRVTLSADSVPALMAMVEGVHTIRRKLRAGLMSRDDAAGELIRSRGTWTVEQAWKEYAAAATGPQGVAKGDAWRSKLAGVWESHWAETMRGRRCEEVTDVLLQAWMERQQRAISPVTRRTYAPKTLVNAWRSMAACLRLAVARERIAREPWRTFRISHREAIGRTRAKTTSLDQLDRLVREARKVDARCRPGVLPDLAMRLVVMVACALRRGEGIALRWDHVDWTAGVVHVVTQAREGHLGRVPLGAIDAAPNEKQKTAGSRRQISFEPGDILHAALCAQKALLEARGLWRDWGPVFPVPKGGKPGFRGREFIPPATVRRLVNASGIVSAGHWVQHGLRHSGAALGVRSGMNVRDLRRMMGHTRAETLQGYYEDAGADAVSNSLGGGTAKALPGRPAGAPSMPVPAEWAELPDAPRTVREVSRSWFDAGTIVGPSAVRERLQAARGEAKLEGIGRREGSALVEIARAHLAAGGEGVPKEALKIARAAYSRAYNQALRGGATVEEARRKGTFARRAKLGGFGRAMRAAREASGAEEACGFEGAEDGEEAADEESRDPALPPHRSDDGARPGGGPGRVHVGKGGHRGAASYGGRRGQGDSVGAE